MIFDIFLNKSLLEFSYGELHVKISLAEITDLCGLHFIGRLRFSSMNDVTLVIIHETFTLPPPRRKITEMSLGLGMR